MIDLGFGIQISEDQHTKLMDGIKMHEDLWPQLARELAILTKPQLRKMVQTFRSPMGMTVKAHYIHAIAAWHRQECIKEAGYVQQ